MYGEGNVKGLKTTARPRKDRYRTRFIPIDHAGHLPTIFFYPTGWTLLALVQSIPNDSA